MCGTEEDVAVAGDVELTDDEDYRGFFAHLATQYYIAGRGSAIAGLIPVCGNLLHYAVEMYLKAALVGYVSIADLKSPKKYSHNIPALWRKFKEQYPEAHHAYFDDTITKLHVFDSIRYPDLIVAEGMYTGVTWTAEEALHAGTSLGLPAYVVTISFVDELVSEVLRCGRMTPRFFVGRYHAEGAAIQSLTYKNPRAMDWAVMPLPPTTT